FCAAARAATHDVSGDHFSDHAADYAKARPAYPPELYQWLAGLAPARDVVWDAGCGSGQASVALAEHFIRVVATDISPQQIAEAKLHDRVEYSAHDEATCPLEPASCDLVTAAQAAHWFDLVAFVAECRRVLKPRGVVAIWGYGLTKLATEIDVEVQRFYTDEVGPFWPSGREHLDDEYRDLELKLEPIDPPPFAMTVTWDLAAFATYLSTWSAVQRYIKAKGEDPIPPLVERLSPVWGPGPRVVSWPLYLRVGRLP
ncbi:MAG: class I SAM-dependent methyltransferase, partial [Gemmatimonadota bacterium]